MQGLTGRVAARGRRNRIVASSVAAAVAFPIALSFSLSGAPDSRALPVMQRRVVVLRYWLQLSVTETAIDLGISEGAVKSRAHRALAHLRSTVAVLKA